MKIYGGVHLRSEHCVIVLIDEDGREISCEQLPYELKWILGSLKPFSPNLEGLAIETDGEDFGMIYGLMDAGYRVHLGHPKLSERYSKTRECTQANLAANRLRLALNAKKAKIPEAGENDEGRLKRLWQSVVEKVSLSLQFKT